MARNGEAAMDSGSGVGKCTLMIATHRKGFLIPALVAVKVQPGRAIDIDCRTCLRARRKRTTICTTPACWW